MNNLPAKVEIAIWGLGFVYCFYCIAFRWTVLTNKYGRLSLYWWSAAMLFAFSMTGYLAAVLVWFIQQEFSN